MSYDFNPENIREKIASWKESLPKIVELGSLYSRNPIAHKWKSTFRSIMVRESSCWRAQDLVSQSVQLFDDGHVLGARILLRSAFETLASLVYLNLIMNKVVEGDLNFHDFSEKTNSLLAGARNVEEGPCAINIVTIIGKCEKRYPGIRRIYNDLSESAHPNWEGLCWGYADVDRENMATHFSNKWMEKYGNQHLSLVALCASSFTFEYNEVWAESFEKLEIWIEKNDAILELEIETDDQLS